MLKYLKISNIALIDNLTVEFQNGLNVLSGETGAGKSIIIDSLSFALGGKFDKTLIKQGETFASVSAFFDNVEVATQKVCEDLGLEKENDLLIFRKASMDKNEIKVNGISITLSMLKQITQTLVDIHGQNENQRILNTKNQLEVLDNYCGESVRQLKDEISQNYSVLLQIRAEIKNIGGNSQDRERALDFLRYQVNEIDNAKLKIGEDEELSQLKEKMLAGEKITDNLNEAMSGLNGYTSIDIIMNNAITALSNVSRFDDKLEQLLQRLKSSKIEIADIVEELEDYRKNLDFNEIEFNKIDARLDFIKVLKKKYGGSVEEIFTFLQNAKTKIMDIENSDEKLQKLERDASLLMESLTVKCSQLSNLRKKGAQSFKDNMLSELVSLAMKNANFEIDFKETNLSRNGTDDIEFLFSANAGQSLRPLGKIISGGEMSRFCLGLKNITFVNDNIASMVFDEVDTGISGKVAEVVAEKMVTISRNKQVLAITHLPQIVAMADNSLLIEKFEENSNTKVRVSLLDKSGHIEEVARLIGMNMASLHAREHAQDLIEFGERFKKSIHH